MAGSCKSLISVSLPGALQPPAALSWDELSETDGFFFFFNYFLLCLSVSKDKHSSPLASAPGTGKLYSAATLRSSLLRAQAPDLQFDLQTVKLPLQLLPRTLCFTPNWRSCRAARSSPVPDPGIFPDLFPVCSGAYVTLRASGWGWSCSLADPSRLFCRELGWGAERRAPPGPWVLPGFASHPAEPCRVCRCARPHQVCTSGLGPDQTGWRVSSQLSLGLQGRCHTPAARGSWSLSPALRGLDLGVGRLRKVMNASGWEQGPGEALVWNQDGAWWR